MSDYHCTLSKHRRLKHRRLTILRFLGDSPEYTSNASILLEVCNRFGVTSTGDQVAGDLAWLRENGFAVFEDHGDFIVATATARGLEIAEGKARHAGVKRPRPNH